MKYFSMSTEEQLVNCVPHTCSFFQLFFLSNLLIKLFLKKQFSRDIIKKQSYVATISVLLKVFLEQISIG